MRGRQLQTKRLFENNQRQFYRELDQEEERCDDDQTVAEESKQFWGNIWSQSSDHKKDAKLLQDLRSEVNVKKTREDRYYHKKLEKDTWQYTKLEVTSSRLSSAVLVKEFQQFA